MNYRSGSMEKYTRLLTPEERGLINTPESLTSILFNRELQKNDVASVQDLKSDDVNIVLQTHVKKLGLTDLKLGFPNLKSLPQLKTLSKNLDISNQYMLIESTTKTTDPREIQLLSSVKKINTMLVERLESPLFYETIQKQNRTTPEKPKESIHRKSFTGNWKITKIYVILVR